MNILATAAGVAAFPVTHIAIPVVLAVWAVICHVFLIPVLLVGRIWLFGLVYLPLSPLLSAARVHYDRDVPVEVALFRVLADALPHFFFFLVQLLHYVIVGILVGSTVGMFTGINISLISKTLAVDQPKPEPKKPKVSPEPKTKVKQEPESPKPEIKPKPDLEEMNRIISALKDSDLWEYLQNRPAKGSASNSPAQVLKTRTFPEEPFEDDDGYNYASLGTASLKERGPGTDPRDNPKGKPRDVPAPVAEVPKATSEMKTSELISDILPIREESEDEAPRPADLMNPANSLKSLPTTSTSSMFTGPKDPPSAPTENDSNEAYAHAETRLKHT